MGRRAFAEAIGTLLVMFSGSAAILVAGERASDASVALAFGLAIAVVTAVVAPVSGAHLNPAVTTAHVASGRLGLREGGAFVAAQLVGGALGTLIAARAAGRSLHAAGRLLANGYDALSPG